MPRSGPVHKVVEPTAEAAQQPLRYHPQPPQAGASAQEVVEGFLAAGVGAQDDYAVARQFLTPQLANTWKPDARVLVHSGKPTTVPRLDDGQFRTTLEVNAELSRNGVLQKKPQGSTQVLDFGLTSVDGQWRISDAPDGVIVPQTDFAQIFTPYTLYFYDRSYDYLVPDSRWFAERSTVPTTVVRALLGGPASYLDSAVTTAVPQGASLARSAVPMSGATATVDLSLPGFDPADVDVAARMHYQLEATLQSVPQVDDVELRANGAPVSSSGSDVKEPVRTVSVPDRQIGVSNGLLAFYQGGQTEPVPGLALPAGTSVSRPGVDQRLAHFGYVDEDRGAVYTVQPGGTPVRRWSGAQLTRPSFDRHGWVWGGNDKGEVHGARADSTGSGERISAPWLAGHHLAGLRISREGDRALVVTTNAEHTSSTVWLAGVVRDDDGRPTKLNEGNAVAVNASADTAQWISNTEFVTSALGNSDNAQPMRCDVSGKFDELPSLTAATSLAGGNGASAIFGAADGRLYLLTGSSWAEQSTDVTDTAFAG